MRDFIVNDLHRSATMEHAEGAYTHDEKWVLTTVLTRGQAQKLRLHVRGLDDHAFITIVNSSEIVGKASGQSDKAKSRSGSVYPAPACAAGAFLLLRSCNSFQNMVYFPISIARIPLWQYRIILSADTASEVRHLRCQKCSIIHPVLSALLA